MYSEQSSKLNGPELSLNIGGKGRNALQWRDGGKRAGPYTPRLKYTPADPEAPGKWGHDLFGQQVEGGNLAFRLKMDPGSSAAEAKIAARNGGGVRAGRSSGGRDLMDAGFDLLGRVQPEQSQRPPRAVKQAEAAPASAKPTKAISILGSSGKTWVLVANLVAGTTAEDVKTTFEQFGQIIAAKSTPAPKGTVSVLLQFEQYAAAQESIKTFHAQIADGQPISVTLHQPATQAPRRQAAPQAEPAQSQAPTSTVLGSRIAPGPTAAGGGAGGLFERLGLPAIGATSSRSAPAPPAGSRAGRGTVGFAESGDLMDMFGDSKMRSDQMDAPVASAPRGRGGRGRAGRSGGRGGGLASRVRGVGGMDVD